MFDLCHNFTLILNHLLLLQLVSVAAYPVTVHLQNESVSCLFQNLTLSLVLQPLPESTGFTRVCRCFLCTGKLGPGHSTQHLGPPLEQRGITAPLHWFLQPSVQVSIWFF